MTGTTYQHICSALRCRETTLMRSWILLRMRLYRRSVARFSPCAFVEVVEVDLVDRLGVVGEREDGRHSGFAIICTSVLRRV